MGFSGLPPMNIRANTATNMAMKTNVAMGCREPPACRAWWRKVLRPVVRLQMLRQGRGGVDVNVLGGGAGIEQLAEVPLLEGGRRRGGNGKGAAETEGRGGGARTCLGVYPPWRAKP